MARPRRPNEPSSYESRPVIPPELQRRYDLIRAVLAERTTISEAAKELGIARVNMQTAVHRAEAAIVTSLEPRAPGKKAPPTHERILDAEVKRLLAENAKLKNQLQAADEMMGAAGEIIRHLRGLPPSSSRTSSARSKRPPKPPSSDDEPERATLSSILTPILTRLRVKCEGATRAARALGVDGKTLRRWLERLCAGEPIIKRRGGTMKPGPPEQEKRVRELVVSLHGLVGAEALAKSVSGVSRRRAGILKGDVKTQHERTRKQESARVEITTPGVVRGFDAMHLEAGYALIATDACVPMRTTACRVPTYDAAHVAAVLDNDFCMHGAPLVLRDDRARCHTAPPVMSVLERHRVLLLQGPPYHAQYYGQLERQNLEHRRWCSWLSHATDVDDRALEEMKNALNALWRRPRLGWCTASEVWNSRPTLDEDRDELRYDVQQRAARLRAHDVDNQLAMRLAIEQALTAKGYLRVTPGRKALCE